MASNPVPPDTADRDDDQPAEDDSAATTLTADDTVEPHGEADGGSESDRYVPV